MRVIGGALAILGGLLAIGAWAQQAPSTATAKPENEPHYDTGTLPKPAPGTTLRGSVVYIYSFLDARMDAIGQRGLDKFHNKLIEALNGAAVRTQWLSSTGADSTNAASDTSRPIPKWFPNLTQTRQPVAVMATIARNHSAEDAAGAQYRLVLFPNYSSQYGYSSSFDIEWTLTDVATGKVIWTFDTTTWYSSLARPALTRTVDNVMGSLKKAKLVN